MAATFALWDLEAGNLVGAFDTEAAARAIAQRALVDQGPESVASLALIHEDEHGKLTTIAEGLALVSGTGQSDTQRNDEALSARAPSAPPTSGQRP
jgi:hypothetical protein